jgi:uncharacterized protein
MKLWMRSEDRVLADLARRFVERDLFRTTYLSEPPSDELFEEWRHSVARWVEARGLARGDAPLEAADQYLHAGTSSLDAYTEVGDTIRILERDGRIRTLGSTAEVTAVGRLAGPVARPYVCAPKDVPIEPTRPG